MRTVLGTKLSSASSWNRVARAVPVLLALGLAACAREGVQPALVGLEVTAPGQRELIFSGVAGSTSEAQPITFKNTGDAPLVLSTLALGGPDAATFGLDAPRLPLELPPGGSAEALISFSPDAAGPQRATLQLESNDAAHRDVDRDVDHDVEIGLYGLGSRGDGGADEPSLQQVADTLGYRVTTGDVAAPDDALAGEEVYAPLFERAGDDPVTLSVVARYGPGEGLSYGMFTLAEGEPTVKEVGHVAEKDAQELLPPVASPALSATGTPSFDPGPQTFGVWAGTQANKTQANTSKQYSLDGLNPGSAHAVRVYPLHDRAGNLVTGSYLLSFETSDATRDFQDAVFVLGNVKLAGSAPELNSGWEPLFNGSDLSGWYSYLPSQGKNNDPEGVFRAENGVLHILGVENKGSREFGYLATEKSYRNYHLRLEYRWGEERFAPRERSKRDSGVVYHVSGPDKVWPQGVEYQIQEGDTGDFWLLGGPTLTTTVASTRPKEPQFAANGVPYQSRSGRFVRIAKDQTHERAGWNTVDIIVRGNTAVHMINGEVNNRAYSLHTPAGGDLDSGKILLQAEGAEVFYRNVEIRSLE